MQNDTQTTTEKNVVTIDGAELRMIPYDLIDPYEEQPREYFEEDGIRSLADSIREEGQNTAIIVTQRPGSSRYVLIGGERRWRACGIISEEKGESYIMKAVFEPYVDEDWLFQAAFIDNVNREDMQPLEVAKGFLRLRSTGKTVEQIAMLYGKSVPYVYNYLSLNGLDERVRALMHPKRSKNNRLGVTHAVEIAKVTDIETQVMLATEVVTKKMTVRALINEVEKLIVDRSRRKLKPSDRRRAVKRALGALEADVTRLSALSEVDIRDLFDKEGENDVDLDSMMFTLEQIVSVARGKREPIMKPSHDMGGTIFKTNMTVETAQRYWLSRAEPGSEPRFLLEIAYPYQTTSECHPADNFLKGIRGVNTKK